MSIKLKSYQRWILDMALLALLVVAAAFGGRELARRAPFASAAHDEPAAAQPGQQAQVYTCSMHPTVRSTNPKDKCPICGMELIPVPSDGDEEEFGDGPRLRLSARSAALMGVRTWPAQRRAVQAEVRVFGRINYDETRLRTITAWVGGRLDELMVNYTGVRVKAGEPMVRMYSPDLFAAQEELVQAARAQPNGANGQILRDANENLLAAARDKLRLLGLTGEQIEQIERDGRASEHVTIHAPVDGTVIERNATAGMYVERGERIYTLADLSRLWVELEAYERDLAWLEVGQKAGFEVEAYPGRAYEAKVVFIEPVLNERTRTVRFRAEVENPDGRLRPGMFVRGRIQAHVGAAATETHADHGAESADPLVIPASAPLLTGRRAVVYVQVADGDRPTYEGRQVVLGPRAGGYYVVREGLKEGELVVTHGNFKIDSELQIRGRPSMMAPEGGGAPASHHGAHPPDQKAPAMAERFETPQAFARQIGSLVRANFALVDALASDDAERSRQAAGLAREALTAVDMGLVQGPAHDAWMASHKTLTQSLTRLQEARDLGAMRDRFEPFSDELTRVVRRFGAGDVPAVYRMLCPMVKGRNAYWLQGEKPLTNPYWGEAMYRCGEISETLVGAEGQ